MNFPERVKIVEVGPRDGLQNESVTVPAEIKVQLVELLADAALACLFAEFQAEYRSMEGHRRRDPGLLFK